MPDSIERFARQLEQQKILAELKECRTIDDYEKLKQKYEAICENHK